MELEPITKKTNLHCQRGNGSWGKLTSTQCPFNPIDDPERAGIWFPAIPIARGVLLYPPLDQAPMPFAAGHRSVGIQIIKIMQVIQPQFFYGRIVPRCPGRNRSGFIQKNKCILGNHALLALAWRYPRPDHRPARRRHLQVGARTIKSKTDTPKDLGKPQMTYCMKVQQDSHLRAAFAISTDNLETSHICSNGIGAAAPALIASRNALTQASCPLSCDHKLFLLKPGQANPLKTR